MKIRLKNDRRKMTIEVIREWSNTIIKDADKLDFMLYICEELDRYRKEDDGEGFMITLKVALAEANSNTLPARILETLNIL